MKYLVSYVFNNVDCVKEIDAINLRDAKAQLKLRFRPQWALEIVDIEPLT